MNLFVRLLFSMHFPIIMRILTTLCLFVLLLSSCKTAFVRTIVYNDPGINDLHVLPTREIPASTKPYDIPYATTFNTKFLPDSLVNALTTTKTVAFLVMKHDSIVYEWYAKGYSDSSHTNPFSATKAIVGVLTGIALKEGKIKSLDEPVGNYLPSFSQDERNKITFRHLLTMSSGVDYYDQYINPFGKLSKLYYGNDMQKLIGTIHAEKAPGTEWRYKNCDPEILTLALQNAVGKNMSDYAAEKLWQPLGANHNAFWTIDSKEAGNEKSYCCFYTNAKDIAKIGMLYEHQGAVGDQQLVDSFYVKQSVTPVNLPNAERGGVQNHYGYLWWLRNVDGVGDFSMEGMRGQFVMVVPKEELIVVRLGVKEWDKSGERFKALSLYPTILRSVLGLWGTKQ